MRWNAMGYVLVVSAVAAGVARAQDEDGPMGFAKRFQERALERQAERLGLSESQREQFLRFHRECQEKLAAAEKARDAAIEGLLTAEQREKLAEQRKGPFGGFGGFGPQVRFGGGDGPMGGLGLPAIESPEALAKKLGLSEDQRSKLETIYADYRKAQLKGVEDLDLSDPEKLMERAGKIAEQQEAARKARDTRIREILTEQQQAEFEKAAKEGAAGPRTATFGLSLGGPDGPAVVLGGEDGGDPAKAIEEARKMLGDLLGGDGKKDGGAGGLLGGLADLAGGSGGTRRLKEELQLSEEESLVLWPLVEKIQTLQRDHQAWRRTQHRGLRRALSDAGEGAAEQLATLREREAAHRKELAALREELRALVTVRQEAVLVGHGILE
jgi:hypothetical protein